jgi:hypothetical protein
MPDENKSVPDKAKDYQTPNRTKDRGVVNELNGSSVVVRENGDVTITSSEMAQYKLTHENSTATEVSIQSNTITNRKNIITDELLINNHKFNPQLYTLADMQQLITNAKMIMGDLTLNTTILVKAWEPNLGKYVLIRRPARMPMFSPTVNIPEVSDQFGVTQLNVEEEIKKLQEEIKNN